MGRMKDLAIDAEKYVDLRKCSSELLLDIHSAIALYVNEYEDTLNVAPLYAFTYAIDAVLDERAAKAKRMNDARFYDAVMGTDTARRIEKE